MLWHVPKIWEDAECWIIGGGPSWLKQFNIPADVQDKSPYLASIHNKRIIAVNNAYQLGHWIDAVFFGDCDWYKTHRVRLANFPGIKVTCCNRFENLTKERSEGIKYLHKDKDHYFGISSDNSTVAWNNNSGAAAISFAYHLGVKRIFLLGFDMCLNNDKTSHWHGSHMQGNNKAPIPQFRRHLKGFPAIAKDAENMGLEIINVNPDSKIECFQKVGLDEVI